MSEDWRNELTARETPRKRRPKGHDPLVSCRAPETVLTLIRAEAVTRNVSIAAVMREALQARYTGSEELAA